MKKFSFFIIIAFLFIYSDSLSADSSFTSLPTHVITNYDGENYVEDAFKRSGYEGIPKGKYTIISYPCLRIHNGVVFKYYNYKLTFYNRDVDCQVINGNGKSHVFITNFDQKACDTYHLEYDPINKTYSIRYTGVWAEAFGEGQFPELLSCSTSNSLGQEETVKGYNWIKFFPQPPDPNCWSDIKMIDNVGGGDSDFPLLPPHQVGGLTEWVPLILKILVFLMGSLLGLKVLVVVLKRFCYL